MENQTNATTQANENVEGQDVEKIELTKKELLDKLQIESDKRVSQALKTAKEKWETEYKEKLETEKAEAEKLAKMSESEKAKVLLDKQQKDLEEQRKAFNKEKLKYEAVKIMNEKQLPIDFVEILVTESAETTMSNIEMFKNKFDAAVQKAVEERFKSSGRDPHNSNNNGPSGVNPFSKETFNLTKQAQLLKENPELAAQLQAAAK